MSQLPNRQTLTASRTLPVRLKCNQFNFISISTLNQRKKAEVWNYVGKLDSIDVSVPHDYESKR